jgi:very-short-patch-repair endonuclease
MRAANAVRDARLRSQGLRVMRFTNAEVQDNTDAVLEAIGDALG